MSYGGTPAAEERHRPRVVEIGASLLAIVGVIGAGRVAYGVLVNLQQDDWHAGARAVFLVLNSIVLVFALFILLLAYQVRRGRLWAWVVSLVMLPFTILYGALTLLITVLQHDVPLAGGGVLLASVAALLTLTVPRAARGYFLRRPVPVAPWQAVPGHPWGPGYPPA
jgi:hypothetical protein